MYAQNKYQITQPQTNFVFDFDYRDKTEVKVYINGIPFTGFEFLGTNTLKFEVSPPIGSVVVIRRETPLDFPATDFEAGSILKPEELDKAVLQLLNVCQEIHDREGLTLGVDDKYDAQGKQIKNLAEPVNPTDAATKRYADGGNLEECKAQANIAIQKAQEAIASAAAAAISEANAAVSAQNAAESEANINPNTILHIVGSGLPNESYTKDQLNSTTSDSGANLIGVNTITGLTGSTVQSVLEDVATKLVRPTGIAFCMQSPSDYQSTPRYILKSNKTALSVDVICSPAPLAATNIGLYKVVGEVYFPLAMFSITESKTTYDMEDVELNAEDVIFAAIDGSVNGINTITIELKVVNR